MLRGERVYTPEVLRSLAALLNERSSELRVKECENTLSVFAMFDCPADLRPFLSKISEEFSQDSRQQELIEHPVNLLNFLRYLVTLGYLPEQLVQVTLSDQAQLNALGMFISKIYYTNITLWRVVFVNSCL